MRNESKERKPSGGFGIDQVKDSEGRVTEVIIVCRRCGRNEGRYTPQEIVEHAFSGYMYYCPKCDDE